MCFFTVLACVVSGGRGLVTLCESGDRLVFIRWVLSSLADHSATCFLAFSHVEFHFLNAVILGSPKRFSFVFILILLLECLLPLRSSTNFFPTGSQILVYVGFLSWKGFEMWRVTPKEKHLCQQS